MSFIGPEDVLPAGTKVAIRNQLGVVVSHERVKAVPCGMIVVHTVSLTHKRVPDYGFKTKIVELPKPVIWTGNYTAIQVIQNNP